MVFRFGDDHPRRFGRGVEKTNPGANEVGILYPDRRYRSFHQRRDYLGNYRKDGIGLGAGLLRLTTGNPGRTAVNSTALFCRQCLMH